MKQGGYPHALQKKATGKATNKVVRETAGWTWPGLTLGTSISVSTRPSWWQNYIVISCNNNVKVEDLDITLDNLAGLCGWVLIDGWM